MGNLCIKTNNTFETPKIKILPPYFDKKNIYVDRFLTKNNLYNNRKNNSLINNKLNVIKE